MAYVDADGLKFEVVRPDGRVEWWKDKDAKETFLNPDWLAEVGYTVVKWVNDDG